MACAPMRRGVYHYQTSSMNRPLELVLVPNVANNAPFYIGRFHFIRDEWNAHRHVVGLGDPRPTDFDGPAASAGERLALHPVVNVSRADVDQLLTALGLRLPSRREWEIACSAGQAGGPCQRCDSTGQIPERDPYPDSSDAPVTRVIVCPDCTGNRVRRPRYPWGNSHTDEMVVTSRHRRFGYWLHSTAPSVSIIGPRELLPVRDNKSWCGAYDLLGNANHWVSDGETAYGGSYASGIDGRDAELRVSNGAAHPAVGFRPVLNLG